MGLTVARRALAFLVQFSLCLVRSKCSVYCRPPLPLEARFHCSETFPKLYLLLALLRGSVFLHTFKIHCLLNLQPCLGPIPVRGCAAGFPSQVPCRAPSSANLMGKFPSCSTQIPINCGEGKCSRLQSQWTAVPLDLWRIPCYLPGWKLTHVVWQSRGAKHTDVRGILLKVL